MNARVCLLALVLLFVANSTSAKCPSGTHVTVVFSNGILTAYSTADHSLNSILAPAILNALGPSFDRSCISFVLAYDSQFSDSSNGVLWTGNLLLQLADAAAQEGIDFAASFWPCVLLTSASSKSCQDLQRQYILSATSVVQKDLLTQESLYNAELAAGHRVIVVAHSQGNLYANQAFELVTASGGSAAMHIVSVATPADHVAGSGPYFTLQGDVITLVPGHLAFDITNDPPSLCPVYPFVNLACHDFDKSYMDVQNGDHTRPAIINAVLGFLQSTPKEFAFVANGSGFYGAWSLSLDPATGTLTPVINPATGLPGFTSPGAAPASISVAVDPAGNFVYVANLGVPISNGNVSGYRVDPATGILTPVNGSPFSAGVGPISVAIHPTGKFIYVGSEISGDVSAFAIDPTTGALSTVLGSPFPPAVKLAVDPSGNFLYATGGGSGVQAFKIDSSTGALTFISSFPSVVGAYSLTVDPTGKFVYAASIQSGSVSAYTIDATTGALTPVAGSPFPGASSAFAIAVDPTGKFVYVANANPTDSISAYTINPSTGALTGIVGSPFPTQGCPAVSVAVDVSAKFVYAACGSNILGYSLDPATGTLTPLAGSPFPGGAQPLSITIK